MAQFVKENFNWDGMYLFYAIDGNQRNTSPDNYKFVARFKYGKRQVGKFRKFLMKHFTVEEYFGALDQGVAPMSALIMKGYEQ